MLLTQICEHGNITVKEGKATGACRSCNVKIYGYQNGYAERKRFNKTLMREFNTYHEGEKWAKKKAVLIAQLENLAHDPEGIIKLRGGDTNISFNNKLIKS